MPEVLTLDVGHTFLFPDPPLGEVYARAAARYGVQVTPAWAERAWEHAWEHAKGQQEGLIYGTTYEEGLDFWLKVNRRVFQDHGLSPEELHAFVSDLYLGYGRAKLWRVDPGLDRLLDLCAELDVPVALVSNWDVRLRGLLDELGLLDRFQEVIISAEVGIEKPDPAIFEHALQRLGRAPERAVHVGDTWNDDILGARKFGMKAIWLAPPLRAVPEALPGVARLESLGILAQHLSHSSCTAG